MNKFSLILENSLYSDDTTKAELLAHKKKLHSVFWITFLGTVGLYILKGDTVPQVKKYFKEDKKLKITSITDDNNDVSVLLPLFKADIGDALINKITRFLVKLRSGDQIDEAVFKSDLFDQVFKKTRALKAFPRVEALLAGYNDGSLSLEECVQQFIIISRYHKFCDEFRLLARKCKIKPTAAVSISQIQTQQTAATAAPATPVAPVKKKRGRPPKIAAPAPTPPVPQVPEWESYLDAYIPTLVAPLQKFYKTIYKYLKGEVIAPERSYDRIAFITNLNMDRTKFKDINIKIDSSRIKNVGWTQDVYTVLMYLNPKLATEVLQRRSETLFENIFKYWDQNEDFIRRILAEADFNSGGDWSYLMNFAKYYNTYFVDAPEFFKLILSILPKLEDRYFNDIIDKWLTIQGSDGIIKIIKDNLTDELKTKLEANGYLQNFVDVKLDQIKFDTTDLWTEITNSSWNVNSRIDKFRETKFKNYSKEEFVQIMVNNPPDYSKITPTNFWVSLNFYSNNVIVELMRYSENKFFNILKIISEKDFRARMVLIPFNIDAFEEDYLLKFLPGRLNYYDSKEWREMFGSLSKLGMKYDTMQKMWDRIEGGIKYNVNFVSNIFGKEFALKMFELHKEEFSKLLSSSSSYSFSSDLSKFLNVVGSKVNEEDFKGIFSKATPHDVVDTVYLMSGLETIDEENLNKVVQYFNNNVDLEDNNGRFVNLTKYMMERFRQNPDLLKNKDLKQMIIKIFKKNPAYFMGLGNKSIDVLKGILEKENDKDIQDALSNMNYNVVFGSTGYSNSISGNNLLVINMMKDNTKKTEVFRKWIVAFKEGNNKSLKRGGVLPDINNFLYDLFQDDPKSVDSMFEEVDGNVRGQLFSELRRFVSVAPLLSNIHTSPIVPQNKLSSDDIKNALKFNNFEIEEAIKVRKKKNEKYSDTLKRTIEVVDKTKDAIPPQEVKKVEKTPAELAKKTYIINKEHHAGKHGEIGAQIVEEFDVHLKMGDWEAFRKEWKDKGDGILKPAFHGTNGMAASMILRFGFAVLSREELENSGGKYAGSMLGAGIYSAPNIDKIANYLGAENYGRLGSVGYMFEMDETLGQNGVHYRSAGLGGDSIRSPEYCAKYPREQIKILKCYKVVKSSLKMISREAEKHGVKLDEEFEKQIWGDELMEKHNNEHENVEGWNIYSFRDGYIPIKKNKTIYFDKIMHIDKNYIELDQNQYGIEVAVRNDVGAFNEFKIYDTHEAMAKKNIIITNFLAATEGKIK